MIRAKPIASPVSTHGTIFASKGVPLDDPTYCRSIFGALQYLTLTWPDITFAVNQMCQFMHAPTESHLTAVKRILWLLKGTLDLGLHLRPGPLRLVAYCDADWVRNPLDHRSITGYCVYFGRSPMSWCFKKQSTVALSSTESEYRCFAHTAAELFRLCVLLQDLNRTGIWRENSNMNRTSNEENGLG